jgi:cephalosporin hydroxylase
MDTDISDHLDAIYENSIKMNPKLIIELGVRDGESSKVFSRVNDAIGSKVIGIDIETCDYSNITNGTFIKTDDIEFGKNYSDSKIDILFIDTSHLYDHTKAEISTFFPLLQDKALVIFHDTNLREVYFHRNGNHGYGWNNNRGVTRAIEEYFGISVDEEKHYTMDITKDGDSWKLIHDPICNGLTLCWKNA